MKQGRFDLQNEYFKLVLNENFLFAPLDPEKFHDALDVGTGTGSWACDLAKTFPKANVIGMDLAPIESWAGMPANCSLIREDVEDEWILGWTFGYIHLRTVFTCFRSPPNVVMYENTRPGGWVEY